MAPSAEVRPHHVGPHRRRKQQPRRRPSDGGHREARQPTEEARRLKRSNADSVPHRYTVTRARYGAGRMYERKRTVNRRAYVPIWVQPVLDMSFRGRLLLFFVIIVVVPMIAVALVLFSITSDSENGKADAAIAQGLRSAGSVYESGRQSARPEVSAVAADPKLGAALRDRNAAAARTELAKLTAKRPDVEAIAVYGPSRSLLAQAGRADAIAFAAASPSTGTGRSLGLVLVSTTDADTYAQQLRGVTGFDVRLVQPDRVLASTVPGSAGTPSRTGGDVKLNGREYRARFQDMADAAGPRTSVGLLEDHSSISSSISSRRLLIGGVPGGLPPPPLSPPQPGG